MSLDRHDATALMEQQLRSASADDVSEAERTMNKELFGVFGDRALLDSVRDEQAFDIVVGGDDVTVGVRDPTLGVPGRSALYEGSRGTCVIWGEAFSTVDGVDDLARWLLDRYDDEGRQALSYLNGSYVVVVDPVDDEALVATDQLRSWECFFTDVDGVRVFGTDAEPLRAILDVSRIDRRSLLEYLHLGTVLGEKTLFDAVSRVPFDGYLAAADTGDLERFVYAPTEFAYVDELADRLERAIDRRAAYPGRKGMLLSAGRDSRTVLAGIPDIEECYTLGDSDCQEVEVARKIARQYDVDHATVEPCGRYLAADDSKVRYGQSIKESLHIHHAGYDELFDVDTMYHALLCDTLFKGYFLDRASVEAAGVELPLCRLNSDPDPVDSLLDTLGFFPEVSREVADHAGSFFEGVDLDAPGEFLRSSMRRELSKCWRRTDSVHNAMDLLVIRNQPVLPFRHHLADNYLESFVAADAGLLDWHLRAPPEYRNRRTFNRAITKLDDDIHRHRPPGRPHESYYLNQAERFLRRKLPFFDEFEPAWPDRREIYEEYGVGDRLFPENEAVRNLPIRHQLRVHDATWWLAERA